MSEQAKLTLTDGVELHVEIDGPVDAPITVVLLHGWCLDRRTWRHQIEALAAHNVRTLAYDSRGHGRSGSTELAGATLGQLGEDLAEVLRRFAPTGPIVLAGHSMGGMTIMEYAHRYPTEFTDRVAGLLLVSTTAEGHTHTSYGLPPRLASVMRAGETLGAGVLARSGPWRPHRAVLPALRPALRWLLFGENISPEALHTTMRCVGRASLRSIGGFRASIGAQQRLDTLAQLGARPAGGMPSAVLVGDRDRLTPLVCAESIAAALPGTGLTVFPGAGHMLPLERPEAVSAALSDVIERALQRSRPRTPRQRRMRRAA